MENLWHIKAIRVGGNPGWVMKRDLSVIPMMRMEKPPDTFSDQEKLEAQKVLKEFGYTLQFVPAEEAPELRFQRTLASGK